MCARMCTDTCMCSRVCVCVCCVRYARIKDLCSWTIMLGTVSGTLVSFLGHAHHVAIISSVTSAIAAWMEFHSTCRTSQKSDLQ